MASLFPRPDGSFWVDVKGANGRRRPVRLGKVSRDDAEESLRRLKVLERCYHSGTPYDGMTAAWLQSLDDRLFERVARTGLVNADRATVTSASDRTLAALIAKWEAVQNVAPQTMQNYRMATGNLVEHLGASRLVETVTAAEADGFKLWLATEGGKNQRPLSRSTVSRRCELIREIFGFAVRLRWIADNPFGHVRREGEWNDDRNYYVTQRLVDALVAAADDPELAGMIALSRYATFRGASELYPLGWSAYDVERQELTVTAPKTARHRGQGRRAIPFRVIRKAVAALDLLWDKAPERTELVFPRLSQAAWSDVTARLERLCRRVGVPLWTKPWINLRASCETDWQTEGYSIFETARWMGHSPGVALRHYNRIAKDHVADLPEVLRPDQGEVLRPGDGPEKRSTRRSNHSSPRGLHS